METLEDRGISGSRFPIRFFAITLFLTAAVLVGLGRNAYHSYQSAQTARELEFRLQELRGTIVHLDDMLTMSARMGAATGDIRWEERYRIVQPQLDDAIKQAISLAPYSREAVIQTDAAHIKTVEMENLALALVRQGNVEEASALLFSEEYENQKQVYTEGMARFTALLRDQAKTALSRARKEAFLSILAVIIVIPVLLLAWLAVLHILRKWQAALLQINRDLTQQTDRLAKANENLASEITERKRTQEALAEQAIRDTLTHLYNRRYFNRRIAEEITRADRNRYSLAILLCDLDHFKVINDAQGHQVGDEVLKAVAQGIQEGTRGTDLVFRWGGDEFVVILSDTTRDGILIAAERIRRGIHTIGEQGHFDLDLSIGVALYPEHGHDLDELIRIADRALYIAKQGGDRIHVGEEEYQLEEHTIKVVFQPVVDIRMDQTVGYEALSRDAQGKLSILALFKKYQAIGQLMELKNICFSSQMKIAQKIGLEKVFINVDFNLLKQLESLPKPSDMEVVLEISEAEALQDVDNHLEIAKKWRELGYKFAIDDFGAGFISLPFIARLIPEHIKLDRSTVLQAVTSTGFRRILKDLLVGLRNCSTDGIIAEGIETAKELEVVKELDIYLVQGYLLGKPEEVK